MSCPECDWIMNADNQPEYELREARMELRREREKIVELRKALSWALTRVHVEVEEHGTYAQYRKLLDIL
jgi:hypothetical protein